MSKRYLISVVLAIMLRSAELASQEIKGIIGGVDLDTAFPYAAIVSSSGVATTVSNIPVTTGDIISVAINNFGTGLIGGDLNSEPYAAFVSPTGFATTISNIPGGAGQINGVAINDHGSGIVGGFSGTVPYAALVTSPGSATTISLAGSSGDGTLFSVAINSLGNAIVGGRDGGDVAPYAALISSSGTSTEVTNLPATGNIVFVAISEQGNGIVGGRNGNLPYAALVSSSSNATAISLPGSSGNGIIFGVAINSLGNGIVGGRDHGNTLAYAALISPSGAATQISDIPTGGNSRIIGVDINDAGTGIIGGIVAGNTPYAAFVSSNGVATRISNLPSSGQIATVAINNQGAAIIGDGSQPYAALVSPSGIATTITNIPFTNGQIISVAILDLAVPKSFGPNSSFANPLFGFSTQVLNNHLLSLKYPNDPQNLIDIALLADASDVYNECEPICSPCCPQSTYSLWASPLLYTAHQKKQGNNPELTNWAAGAMVGFDYYGFQNAIFGLGAAYAFDYVHLFDGIGHAKINEEFITLYGASRWEHFYINASLWGGLYQVDNERHTVGIITSTSDYDGWLLSPHLEMSFPFTVKTCSYIFDPFVMFDWANNWQSHIHEKGSAGFNLIIGNQYTSLLRSEAGLRFFQSLQYCWGTFVLMEKASYVNKLPFHAGTSSAIFVAGTAPFGVEMFTNRTQNLGVGQFEMTFVPTNSKYPYGSINYQGEFGSTFQSHLVSFEVGKEF